MVEELSLVIQNPEEGDFLKKIDWNQKEFMDLVASITKQYQGVVYSDDQMKIAKSDRAKLNAMKKRISERRIQVKNAVMEPYSQFEKEVAEVTRLIDEPIAMIDGQIKEYESRVKENKQQTLQEYYDKIGADLDGILTFDRIFDQRYLNVSVSLNKAKTDMKSKVEQVKTDLQNLEAFCEDKYLTIAKDAYIKTLDVSKALAEAKRMQEFDRKAEEERQRRQEEKEREAARAEENVIKPHENVIKEPETVVEQPKSVAESEESVPQSEIGKSIASIERHAYEQATSGSIDVPDPISKAQEADTKKYKASFTVYGTKAQIMALRDYMNEHNIKFGKVEK